MGESSFSLVHHGPKLLIVIEKVELGQVFMKTIAIAADAAHRFLYLSAGIVEMLADKPVGRIAMLEKSLHSRGRKFPKNRFPCQAT